MGVRLAQGGSVLKKRCGTSTRQRRLCVGRRDSAYPRPSVPAAPRQLGGAGGPTSPRQRPTSEGYPAPSCACSSEVGHLGLAFGRTPRFSSGRAPSVDAILGRRGTDLSALAAVPGVGREQRARAIRAEHASARWTTEAVAESADYLRNSAHAEAQIIAAPAVKRVARGVDAVLAAKGVRRGAVADAGAGVAGEACPRDANDVATAAVEGIQIGIGAGAAAALEPGAGSAVHANAIGGASIGSRALLILAAGEAAGAAIAVAGEIDALEASIGLAERDVRGRRTGAFAKGTVLPLRTLLAAAVAVVRVRFEVRASRCPCPSVNQRADGQVALAGGTAARADTAAGVLPARRLAEWWRSTARAAACSASRHAPHRGAGERDQDHETRRGRSRYRSQSSGRAAG